MYANICRTTNSIERKIAERQQGMKAINDNSWFSKIRQIIAISWIIHLQKMPGKRWLEKTRVPGENMLYRVHLA
jgi:capsid portal protein